MEAFRELLEGYGVAAILIALFCYSISRTFRLVPALNTQAVKNWMPVIVLVLGGLLAACLPWMFAAETPVSLRVFIGIISGANAVLVIAFFRRQAKLLAAKKFGDKEADTLFAPVDESGSTLAPEEDNSKLQQIAQEARKEAQEKK